MKGLYLPRVRIDLGELQLMRGDDFASFVEDQEPGASRTLINRSDKSLLRAIHFEVCRTTFCCQWESYERIPDARTQF